MFKSEKSNNIELETKVFYLENQINFIERNFIICNNKIILAELNGNKVFELFLNNIKDIIISHSKFILKINFEKKSFIIVSFIKFKKILNFIFTFNKDIKIKYFEIREVLKLKKINKILIRNINNHSIFSSYKFNFNILNSYKFIKLIDRGAFSKVFLVKKLDIDKFFVIKVIKKKKLEKNNEYFIINNEYKVLKTTKNKFLIELKYSFQDNENIYFVFDYISGGNLFNLIYKQKNIKEDFAKFYVANICIAINYLHSKNYIYKDLKLENILINEDGYLKLIDFGLCQYLSKNQYCYLFSGTPEYIAPEVILLRGHNFSADWWSIGIILYELIVGIPPFFHNQISKIYVKIVKEKVAFPNNINISEDCKDLILKLLEKNPLKRLNSLKNIIKHPWFRDFNFNKWLDKELKSPFRINNKLNKNELKINIIKNFNIENKNTMVCGKNNFFLNNINYI